MKEVKCSKCGYEWESRSEKMYVTCPNCQVKSKILEMVK